MPPEVLQRDDWQGAPRKQGETFRLRKGQKRATCELWSHPLGWELKLFGGSELLQSHVCRSQDEVLDTSEQWKKAMIGKGWR